MPRRSRRPALAVLVVLAVAATIAPGSARPVAARDGDSFVSVVNGYRADAGLAAVRLHTAVDRIAVERANRLAADRALGHDMEYVKDRLADEGVCWQQLGEIVAYNGAPEPERVERFGEQWYLSPGHRSIMLGSGYTHAGGSWKTGADGRHYAAMVFVSTCGADVEPITYGGFTDIAGSKFRDDIVWLVERGITTGCSSDRFCPTTLVERDQMATFIARAMDLPAASRDWFTDDATNPHESRINRLADAELTRGCGATAFCPDEEVSRGQLASFLARALALPPASRDHFRDDDWSAHEDAINRIAEAGVTLGCAEDRFCPRGPVKREQMAAFLRRAFD
jgi:uncharacterized protein YkwD